MILATLILFFSAVRTSYFSSFQQVSLFQLIEMKLTFMLFHARCMDGLIVLGVRNEYDRFLRMCLHQR